MYMYTSVMKEICSYYKSRRTDVYTCMLDASKAFDCVHYGKLFNLLRDQGLSAVVLRFLLDMHTKQWMRTNGNAVRSDLFYTANGVKQGGILSPILCCVYFDELLKLLKASGLGCHVGHLSYAGCGYAPPPVRALQQPLDICNRFAAEYNVMFNDKKILCMRVGNHAWPTP